ncbi:hypothetical protein Tco_0241437 [Tanacetum coccineum]
MFPILESFKNIAKVKFIQVIETKEDRRGDTESEPFIVSPPGFTPVGSEAVNIRDHVFGEEITNMDKEVSPMISAKVMNFSQAVQEEVSCNSAGQSEAKNGGSVLGVLEEVIRVGQAMGYSMEGCEKDVESIIRTQGEDVRSLGNLQAVVLCIRGNVFKKVMYDPYSFVDYLWTGNRIQLIIILWDINAPHQPIIYGFMGHMSFYLESMERGRNLQELKKIIRYWIKDKNSQLSCSKQSILKELRVIDKELDQGGISDSSLLRRHELKCQLNDIKAMEATDSLQKSKVRWH